MKGRKPTPTVLRILRGNPGKRALNDTEAKFGPLDLVCPPALSDEEARAEWDRTILPAIERGLVTVGDRALAIAHCELWATWRSQLDDASKHAHVIAAGKNKYPMPNVARQMANATLALLTRVDVELGLTPSSRSRVKVEAPAKQDRFSRFDQTRRHGKSA